MRELSGRIVVLSPHLDDAVLSLGGTIARSVRTGAAVEVLTVLAGDPGSAAPAGRWDAMAGFRSAGEAARLRRAEDVRACAVLGAASSQLAFPDKQYGRPDDDAVHEEVARALAGADLALVPGFPLGHSDHAWLVRLILERGVPAPVALYAEWPYSYEELARGVEPRVADALEGLVPPVEFVSSHVGLRDLLAKWRAVRRYRSQIRLLASLVGRSRVTPGLLVWAHQRAGGERIGWQAGPPLPGGNTVLA